MEAHTKGAGRIRHGPGGTIYKIVTTAAESGGRHFVGEVIEQHGGGPPLHVHHREDEYFYVLEGEITIILNGRKGVLRPGEGAFLPRDIPHAFKNCSSHPARMLFVLTPGELEGFFDYGMPLPDGSAPPDDLLVRRIMELAPKFGIDVLGPSPL